MAHWCDTWPHEIVASVILKDNKIKLWKVGENALRDKYNISMLVKEHPEYSYQEKEWTVHNDKGHNLVFGEYAPDWFKQWNLHEDYRGMSPFEKDDFDLSGAFEGRFQVLKPLKLGD